MQLVPEGGIASVQSQKSHVIVAAVCPDPMVSAAFIPSDVYQAEFGSLALVSGVLSFSNADDEMFMEVDAAEQILNLGNVQPMEVDTTFLCNGATNDNAGTSVSILGFS